MDPLCGRCGAALSPEQIHRELGFASCQACESMLGLEELGEPPSASAPVATSPELATPSLPPDPRPYALVSWEQGRPHGVRLLRDRPGELVMVLARPPPTTAEFLLAAVGLTPGVLGTMSALGDGDLALGLLCGGSMLVLGLPLAYPAAASALNRLVITASPEGIRASQQPFTIGFPNQVLPVSAIAAVGLDEVAPAPGAPPLHRVVARGRDGREHVLLGPTLREDEARYVAWRLQHFLGVA